MVRIDRVTTRTGDAGTSRLADGSVVPKDHPVIRALGAVDTANGWLGLVLADGGVPDGLTGDLISVQHRLFDLGADLASPLGGPHEERIPRIDAAMVVELEAQIARCGEDLPPLTSFVLPGGRSSAAHLHLARCAVREAECAVVAAWPDLDRGPIAGQPLLQYLNRLSDYCFQLARAANDHGREDILWEPGRSGSA